MRSLYWKIFLTFWLTSIFIIVTTAWVISEFTQKSARPAHEKVFMDTYATAAVATFESGQIGGFKHWLEQAGAKRNLTLFLLTKKGQIIGTHSPPPEVMTLSMQFAQDELDDGLLKFGPLLVSHEIVTPSKQAFRLVALQDKLPHHIIEIPLASLLIRLSIAILFSGAICYLLSIYLTKPLRFLSLAAKSIAKGHLQTRVGIFKGHGHDEIAELSAEFDRMAEELEKMLQSKERLLQDISHELRSPLTRLQIAIELGRNKSNGLASAEYQRMEQECYQLNKLIGEILEFARLDKSPDKPTLNSVNIQTLVSQLIQDANFEFALQDKRAELIIASDHAIASQTSTLADGRLLSRAIENILRNALHHTIQHSRVKVSLAYHEDHIIIQIEDEGSGVLDEQLALIFTPFYRVDTSRTKKTGGYGLGLAIAKKAIEIHHGTIIVHNKPAGGLIVRIEIPCL